MTRGQKRAIVGAVGFILIGALFGILLDTPDDQTTLIENATVGGVLFAVFLLLIVGVTAVIDWTDR